MVHGLWHIHSHVTGVEQQPVQVLVCGSRCIVAVAAQNAVMTVERWTDCLCHVLNIFTQQYRLGGLKCSCYACVMSIVQLSAHTQRICVTSAPLQRP